jgi:UDP-N-acetylmuramoyl-L-alanyl-D-glutamate--2,6-diaminopimelate ligase
MTLRQLLSGLDVRRLNGDDGVAIQGLHYDSRQIATGFAFVAIRGEQTDGNNFIDAAIRNGAVAVISEEAPRTASPDAPVATGADPYSCAWVQVANARRALAAAAANWYGRPADRLRLVGITGTNGKTTTAFLCDKMLHAAGLLPGLIGTVEYHVGTRVLPSPHTTPESLDLQALFAEMVAAGSRAAVMEVSSHALAMDRVHTCHFDAAVFTNLTQDHLDYHHSMENYLAAKRRLFEGTGAGQPAAAVLNADDRSANRILAGFRGRVLRFGFSASADLRASALENTPAGLRFTLDAPGGWHVPFASPLIGRVNVLNLLAAVGVGLALDFDRDLIVESLQSVTRVPGRFERVYEGQPFTVIVDYAHTPDALANVLQLAAQLRDDQRPNSAAPTAGAARPRIITLFGCGGDRDRGKRPLMGEAAGNLSDIVVLTSDNPRHEDPVAIINEALPGLRKTPARAIVEPDRQVAIRLAIAEAAPGDIVVLAGKGHEIYQVIGDAHVPFSDFDEARAALRARADAPSAASH